MSIDQLNKPQFITLKNKEELEAFLESDDMQIGYDPLPISKPKAES